MLPNHQSASFNDQPIQYVYLFGAFNMAFYCDQPFSLIMQWFLLNFHLFFICTFIYYQGIGF